MKTQLTTGIGTRGVTGAYLAARSMVLRTTIAVRDLMEARSEESLKLAGPSVQERISELARFQEEYEEFVEVLCDSAQYGPAPRLDTSYDRLRDSVVERYVSLRPFLGAFLSPEDLDAFRFESGRPQDAFEKLFAARSLQEFLHHDDGEMIFRIMKTREALSLYSGHLQQLASRIA